MGISVVGGVGVPVGVSVAGVSVVGEVSVI